MPCFCGSYDFHNVGDFRMLLFEVGFKASPKYTFVQGAAKDRFTSSLQRR